MKKPKTPEEILLKPISFSDAEFEKMLKAAYVEVEKKKATEALVTPRLRL